MTVQGTVRGELGKPRSIWKSIGLAVITLGIYMFVWTYKTHGEISTHSGQGVGAVLGLVIFLVVSPVTYFVVPSETRKMYEQDGRTSPVKGITGLWLLLPLIGSVVWFVKVQRALNDYWTSKGAPSPA